MIWQREGGWSCEPGDHWTYIPRQVEANPRIDIGVGYRGATREAAMWEFIF